MVSVRGNVVSFFLALLWAAPVTLCAQAPAASVWSQAASPTTVDLNAVVAAIPPGSPYVAVGNGGTVISSDDGIHWATDNSGTEANLLAVAFGESGELAATFIAVGAGGTILSSRDGVQWTLQRSGTSSDLRAVAYSGLLAEFMAVGAAGTVLTSPDGTNWSSMTGVPTRADLNAIVLMAAFGEGPGGFVAAGDAGTLLCFPLGGVQTINSGTAQDVEMLAPETAFAAQIQLFGTQGLLGTLSFSFQDVPSVDTTGASLVVGDFTAAAVGEIGTTTTGYALTADGSIDPLPAGNGTAVQLPAGPVYRGIAFGSLAVVVGSGGAIWVNTATGSGAALAGATVSGLSDTGMQFAGQTVTLQAQAVTGATYQWYFNGAPIAGATQSTLVLSSLSAASAGKYVVQISLAGAFADASAELSVEPVAAFSPGLVDPAFRASVTGLPAGITLLPSGNILYGGNQLLNANGSPAASIPDGFAYCHQVLVQPDGKWIEAENQGSQTTMIRFNADGSVDQGFAIDPDLIQGDCALALLPSGEFVVFSNNNSMLTWWRLLSDGAIDPAFGSAGASADSSGYVGFPVAVADAQGRTYVGLDRSSGVLLLRLDANQRIDPSFALPPLLFSGQSEIAQMLPVAGGLLYAASSNGAPLEIGLLNESGAPASGYATQVFATSSGLAALASDGTAVVLVPAASSLSPLGYALHRLTASGQIDPNYGGFVIGDSFSHVAASEISEQLSQMVVQPNGQLLVEGEFNSLNTVSTSGIGRLTPDTNYAQTRLVNMSVRGQVTAQAGLNVSGYVGGTGTVSAVLRGIGPTLADYGVPNPLPDPEIQLYEGQTEAASNDDWSANGSLGFADAEQAVGAFSLPANSLDAGLVASLTGGPFSLLVTGKGGEGIALGEIYDANPQPTDASQPRLTNLSALAFTAPGSEQLTAGFVVGGADARQLLIRAVGPGLAPFGVTGVPDPTLTLYSGTNVIASNAGWGTNSNPDQVTAAETAVGAFTLTTGSADSVLLVVLPPGSYTAAAGTASGDAGTVLLEVYEVP